MPAKKKPQKRKGVKMTLKIKGTPRQVKRAAAIVADRELPGQENYGR